MRAQVHLQAPSSRSLDAAEVTPLLVYDHDKPHMVGTVLVVFAAVAFSLVATYVKYISVDLTSVEATFWRFGVAYAFVLILALYSKVDLLVAPQYHWDLAWRCVFGTASVLSFFWAITQMALADASTIAATSPVVVSLVGVWLRREPVGLVDIVTAAVAVAGIVFVARPNVVFEVPIISYGSPYACLGAVGSAVFVALANAHVQKLSAVPTLVVTHYLLLVGATISGIWVLVAQGRFSLHGCGRTVAQATIASGLVAFLGDLALSKGLQQLEHPDTSTRTNRLLSMVQYVDLAFVFLWDVTLIHERVNWWSVLGAVLVTAAVVTVHYRRATRASNE